MSNITINHVELASELAHIEISRYFSSGNSIYIDNNDGCTQYTTEIQDIFNGLYDMYYELIETTKTKQL